MSAASDPWEFAQEVILDRLTWLHIAAGYQAIQKTKPQTLGYGLNDSPVGEQTYAVEEQLGCQPLAIMMHQLAQAPARICAQAGSGHNQ